MAENRTQDFDRMQREAIDRVREMQRRARNVPSGNQPPPEQKAPAPPAIHDPKPQTGSLSELLSGIKIDEEKALIGLLIYVLYKNGGDIKLMLALGYLLL